MNQERLNRKISLGSLLQFTLPTVAMMLFTSVYSLADGFFASRYIDTDAFAAINIVYPVLVIIIALGNMFGTGTTAIITRKLGQGKGKEARADLTFILVVTFVLGILLSVAMMGNEDLLVRFLGANNAIASYSESYLWVQIFVFPLILLQMQFQYYFSANGRPHLGMVATFIGGGVNILLDFVFTVLLNMGITGIALASSIGYGIAAFIGIFYFIFMRKEALYIVTPKIDWRLFLNVMSNGSSELVSNLATSITTILFNRLMMAYIGEDGVAAIAVILYLDYIIISSTIGYASGVAPLIGYNYGCEDKKKLIGLYKISQKLMFGIGAFMFLLTFFFNRPLVSIFADSQDSVFQIASGGLMIYGISYWFKMSNIFYSAFFTAFSEGKVSAWISFMRTFVFLILSMYLTVKIWGIDGIWWAVPLAEGISFLLGRYFLHKNKNLLY